MTGQTYDALTDGEWQWLLGHVEKAADLGMDVNDAASIETAFDRTMLAIHRGELPMTMANDLVNATGIALGEHIRRAIGFKWAIMTDEQGSDLVLYGGPPQHLTLFPQSTVAKRWEERETGWIRAFAADIAERIRSIG